MIEIIPALMPRTFEELREQIGKFVGIVSIVQIDVMDGVFVPEKSWPYSENKNELQELASNRNTIPFWEDIDFEADLMLANPEQETQNWILCGASRIIVHIESVTDMDFIIAEVRDSISGKQIDINKEKHIEIGVALNIDTPNKIIEPWVNAIDFVQCMGVAKIGYQGQPFDKRAISKIEDLRERYPEVIISVDGGVNFESAARLIAAGATRLVSGSAILKNNNFEEAISKLRSL